MEDTLRETVVNNGSREYSSVLILVLMEDTLRAVLKRRRRKRRLVLILVLMEDTLRV